MKLLSELSDNALREYNPFVFATFSGLKQAQDETLLRASLLLASGISIKMIQDWLGHSDFGTTADLYTHLSYDSKLTSADALQTQTAFAKMEIE